MALFAADNGFWDIGGPQFFILGKDNTNAFVILYSKTGLPGTWSKALVPAATSVTGQGVARTASGTLYATLRSSGNALLRSTDNGASWSTVSTLNIASLSGDVAYGNGTLAVFDLGNKIWSSTNDGASWTSAATTISIYANNYNLVFGNGYFVTAYDLATGLGTNGLSMYSTNATSWTNTSLTACGCSFVNGQFALMGYGTGSSADTPTLNLSLSADPTVAAGAWTSTSFQSQTYALNSSSHIAYQNGVYAANNTAGISVTANPAGTWTNKSILDRWAIVAGGNNGFIAGSCANTTTYYYSTDNGTTWNSSTLPYNLAAVGDIKFV